MELPGTIGFLGFGNMGKAILGGLLDTGIVTPEKTIIHDIMPGQLNDFVERGVRSANSPAALVENIDYVILAVKPQQAGEALEQLSSHHRPEVLYISIMAGITIDYISSQLGGPAARVVRVMPNTPALVQTGAAGMAFSPNCTAEDRQVTSAIFNAVGLAVEIDEAAIDVVTALSGSGPAYFFYLVECLIRSATAQGFPEDQAARLAGQTLLGAGRLLMETGASAAALRSRVTSPGGTTEAAIRTFEEKGFAAAVQAGFEAALRRAGELSR